MRNADFATLEEVVQKILARSPHKPQLTAAAVRCAWKAIMPDAVHKRTESIFVKQGKLFVKLNSAALSQELRLNNAQVLIRLKEHIKDSTLEEVIFV